MNSLTTFDAGFLDAHVSPAVGIVAVMKGPLPERDSLLAVLTERTRAVPRLRQVLHTKPFDLGAPRWVGDANFDVSHHVHSIAVPHPGDDDTLYGLAADVMGWPLDRDRPLWESWIIEGLSNNRWALLIKVHHRIADGIDATRLFARLCDGATWPTRIRGSRKPRRWIGGMWHSSIDIATTAARACEGAMELVAGLVWPTATSSPTGRVTRVRRYAAVEVSVDDVAKVYGVFTGRGEEPQHDSVPGPRRRVRIMGRDVVRLLPIPSIAHGLRTGVAILNYADKLVFGVSADFDAMPQLDHLAQGIQRAVARLVAIDAAPRRSSGKGTLYLVPNEPLATAQ
jgi:hypothetical protein